jgi:hypothetical protein
MLPRCPIPSGLNWRVSRNLVDDRNHVVTANGAIVPVNALMMNVLAAIADAKEYVV